MKTAHHRGNPNLPLVFINIPATLRENPAVNVHGLRTPGTSDQAHGRYQYAISYDGVRLASQWFNGRTVDGTASSLRDELIAAVGADVSLGECIGGAAAVGLLIDDTRVQSPDCRLYGTADDCRREARERPALASAGGGR